MLKVKFQSFEMCGCPFLFENITHSKLQKCTFVSNIFVPNGVFRNSFIILTTLHIINSFKVMVKIKISKENYH